MTVLMEDVLTLPTRERAHEVIATSKPFGDGCYRKAFLDDEARMVYKVNLYGTSGNRDEWRAYQLFANCLPFGIVVPRVFFLPGISRLEGPDGDIIAMPLVEGRRLTLDCFDECTCEPGGYPCWRVRSEQARSIGLRDVYPNNFRMDSTGLIILFDLNCFSA